MQVTHINLSSHRPWVWGVLSNHLRCFPCVSMSVFSMKQQHNDSHPKIKLARLPKKWPNLSMTSGKKRNGRSLWPDVRHWWGKKTDTTHLCSVKSLSSLYDCALRLLFIYWSIGALRRPARNLLHYSKPDRWQTESYRLQFWWTLAIAVLRLRVPVGVFMLDTLKQDISKCDLLLPAKTWHGEQLWLTGMVNIHQREILQFKHTIFMLFRWFGTPQTSWTRNIYSVWRSPVRKYDTWQDTTRNDLPRRWRGSGTLLLLGLENAPKEVADGKTAGESERVHVRGEFPMKVA